MAYVCGMLFGKRKLLERISPKKTWEGAVGGLLFAMLAAYIVSIFYKELSLTHWLTLAAIISIFGTLGDLSESMLKRSIGVKDSGNILPGHGGLLDRFDALFLAIPAVYLYLQFT
jgi:phosphatidate cytidylyltransferase